MEVGLGVFALGELQYQETKARRAAGGGAMAEAGIGAVWQERHNEFVFNVKSQVHGLRASLYGRKIAEDKLIEALKLENANHPLASREAVDVIIDNERARALLNPDVIKKTYPDGRLPKGAVLPPDLVQQVV